MSESKKEINSINRSILEELSIVPLEDREELSPVGILDVLVSNAELLDPQVEGNCTVDNTCGAKDNCGANGNCAVKGKCGSKGGYEDEDDGGDGDGGDES
jgi:hypothetical protein